jgi:acetyltransferase-like isoleucine patch superfamily enzyme
MTSTWRGSRHSAIQLTNVVRSRWVLRHCNRVGRLTRLAGGTAIVENRGSITIGDGTRLMAAFAPIELRTGPGGRLTIGDRGAVNYGTSLRVVGSAVIGDDVDIGPYCLMGDTELGDLDAPLHTSPRPVRIGDSVWLAARVSVHPGAVIGDGTVVAAGSVVEGELPARVVAAGNPARVVRHLDPQAASGAESTVTGTHEIDTDEVAGGPPEPGDVRTTLSRNGTRC